MYSLMTVVNSSVLFTWKLLRDGMLNVLTKKDAYEFMWRDRGVN